MIDKYNDIFLKLIVDMQVFIVPLNDKQTNMINSALHDFDRDIRKLINKMIENNK